MNTHSVMAQYNNKGKQLLLKLAQNIKNQWKLENKKPFQEKLIYDNKIVKSKAMQIHVFLQEYQTLIAFCKEIFSAV